MPSDTSTLAVPNYSVRVRMYRQGLGDCFLLRFPGENGRLFHLVIDSGVIKGTSEPTIKMREVAEDIESETGGKVDVLVVTHEHWDHVSGFAEAREVWERMEIAEVWLAWTEDPANKLAKKLRRERADRKEGIKSKIAQLAAGSSFQLDATRSQRIDALLGFLGFSLGAASIDGGGTKEALDFIADHAKEKAFQKPGSTFTRADLPGVRVYILGPPEEEAKLKKSNPSTAHPEVYSESGRAFAASESGNPAQEDADLPFGTRTGSVVETPKDYDNYLQNHFPKLVVNGPDPKWRRIVFSDTSGLERLALALDGDTNNTSLALAFELRDGRVLLFPADAQVGNWLSWQDYKWKAGTKSVQANDLLARTVLYKVGHHGSHNATLRDLGLEKMTHQDLMAIVPVNKAMAKKKGWNMPFPPLYQRLQEKTRGRVLLADAAEPLPESSQLTGLTTTERNRFKATVSASALFIDITL